MTSECFIFANGQRIGPLDLAQIQALAPTLPADAQIWIPPGGWRSAGALLTPAPIIAPPPTTAPFGGVAPPATVPISPTVPTPPTSQWPPHDAGFERPQATQVWASPPLGVETSGKGMSTGAKVLIGIGLVFAGFIVLGLIGSMGGKNAPTATSPTVATSPGSEATPQPAETLTESDEVVESNKKTTGGRIRVPNGVGMNYQDAQDLWRSQGLLVMPAEDATGANRMPVLDSGWVVLSQSPAAGTTVEEGGDITATVKKYTDD